MIKFYYHPAPNPAKVALFLEEAELEYEVIPIDIRTGEQFTPEFLAVNPNAKTPALVDGDAVLFDSSAIILYLAEKTGRFLPENTPAVRAQLLSWLMFIASGVGPYSGQAAHFRHFAPEPKAYAVNRYTFEMTRHWDLIENRLAATGRMIGDSYTILDMSVWGWARPLPFILGREIWERYPNVQRLYEEINARPAGIRAAALATRFQFKKEMDEAARANMFPSNKHLVAE